MNSTRAILCTSKPVHQPVTEGQLQNIIFATWMLEHLNGDQPWLRRFINVRVNLWTEPSKIKIDFSEPGLTKKTVDHQYLKHFQHNSLVCETILSWIFLEWSHLWLMTGVWDEMVWEWFHPTVQMCHWDWGDNIWLQNIRDALSHVYHVSAQLNFDLWETFQLSNNTQLKSIFLKWTRIIYSSLMLSQVGVTSVSVDIVLIDTGLSHGHHCSTPILIVWRNVWISAWLPRHQPTHFVIFIIHNSGYWSLSCLSISGPGSGDPTDHATPHCHHTW